MNCNAALSILDNGGNSYGYGNTFRMNVKLYQVDFSNVYGNASSVLHFDLIANNEEIFLKIVELV